MAICVLLDESFCVSLLQCYEGYEYAEEVGVRIDVRFACCAEKVPAKWGKLGYSTKWDISISSFLAIWQGFLEFTLFIHFNFDTFALHCFETEKKNESSG